MTSVDTFSEWYKDALGTNLSTIHAITLVKDGAGVYEFRDTSFFPIDGRLHDNEGRTHNYHFTYMLGADFEYTECAGQFFEFEGSDDAWLFIGDDLAIDLGGVQPGTPQRIDLDRLELIDGETYRMALYYAQRTSTAAAFGLRTNIAVDPTATPFGTASALGD